MSLLVIHAIFIANKRPSDVSYSGPITTHCHEKLQDKCLESMCVHILLNTYDLVIYEYLYITLRGQGQTEIWKLEYEHKSLSADNKYICALAWPLACIVIYF